MPGKGPGVFEQELGELESKLGLTTVEKMVHWAQGNSIWPVTFGLACCAIEMMAIELVALRHRALRRRGLPRLAAPVRPDDRRRPVVAQDGRAAAPDLRPDARAEVGDLDGRLRDSRRRVRQLRDRAGRRPDRAGRRLRAGLPAAARGARSTASSSSRRRSRQACRPRTRSAGSRAEPYEGVPGLVERTEAYGETTLVVDAGPHRRGVHAPPRRGRLQLPVRHHGRRLPRLGRAAVAGYYRDRRPGATSTGRAHRASRACRTRSRPASRSTTTCWRSRAPRRVRVQVWLDDGQRVPSVVEVWPTADWHEREAYDMMGIAFDGHPNLSRILMRRRLGRASAAQGLSDRRRAGAASREDE